MGVATRGRFWAERDKLIDASDLGMADIGHGDVVGLHPLTTIVERRCAVLLGSPGSGKSTELAAFVEGKHENGECVQFEDLREFTQGDALLGAISRGQAATHAGSVAYLVLDSLDESPMSASTLARILIESAAATPVHVRIVIACRTAAWNIALEAELASRFDDFKVFDLAPFSSAQALAMALEKGVDGQPFLSYVEATGAADLIGSPLMVEMLVEEARDPTHEARAVSQSELFSRAVRRLLKDPDGIREPTHSIADLEAASSLLAAVALLSGSRAFWLGEDEAPHGCLSIDQFEGIPSRRLQVGAKREVILDRALLITTFRTALFTSAGHNRVWFGQQTLAEFLGASALAVSALPASQIERLVRGRKGLVAPQVQALSAWLLALQPDSYSNLIDEDPVSFLLSGAEIQGEAYRRALLTGVLELASRHEISHTVPPAHLRTLQYPGVAHDLDAYIGDADASPEARYLAVRVARQNEIAGSAGALQALALSAADDVFLRSAAAHALLDFHPSSAPVLANGLLDDSSLAVDVDDQLRGVGITAALNAGWSLARLVPILSRESNEDFFGSYRMAMHRDLPAAVLRPDVSTDDLMALAEWALQPNSARDVQSRTNRSFGELSDAVLIAVSKRAQTEGSLQRPLSLKIMDRVLSEHALLAIKSGPGHGRNVDEAARKQLLRTSAEALGEQGQDIGYGAFVICRDLASGDDLSWFVAESLAATSDQLAESWGQMARAVFDPARRDHLDLCLDSPEGSILYREAFAVWREAVPLDSDRAKWMRRAHAGGERREDTEPLGELDLRDRIADALEAEGSDAFLRLYSLLRIDPHEAHVPGLGSSNLKSLPCWPLVSQEQYQGITELAMRQLDGRSFDPENELGTNSITFGAIAAVAAGMWLSEMAREGLTCERLRYWTPSFIHFVDSNEDGDAQLRLAGAAFSADSDYFLSCLAREVQQENGEFVLRRMDDVLDDRAADWLRAVIFDEGVTDQVGAQALALLIKLDVERGRDALAEVLGHSGSRGVVCAVAAVQAGVRLVWSVVQTRLAESDIFARDFIEGIAYRESMDLHALDECEVAWLWEASDRLFPPSEDPVLRGVHAVGSRESAGHFRDRLLPALADRGTDEAIAALDLLALRRPEYPWIRRLWAEARRRNARDAWTPIDLDLLLTLWLDPSKQLIGWSGDLLAAVVSALEKVQVTLTDSPNPEASLLWNHGPKCENCQPKSEDELNDYIAARLRDRLPSLVVSREVEVNRRAPRGIGERPDLLVSAATGRSGEGPVQVAIEGKGCWNAEVLTGAEVQLRDRYMAQMPASSGLLLAYWFEPEHLSAPRPWTRDPTRADRHALRVHLESEADRLSTQEAPMAAFVLHASLGWQPRHRDAL
jgi:hypothetical protein